MNDAGFLAVDPAPDTAGAAALSAPALARLVAGVAAAIVAVSGARTAEIPVRISADGKTEILKVHAEGVQIYECRADVSGGMKWQFREPLAVLLKDGKTVGRHFVGPNWELASGSAVVGKVEAQAPGAMAGDIALLKLKVVEKRGAGELDKVTTVQRLETKGGMFGGSCDKHGQLHLEPYAADYVFLGD